MTFTEAALEVLRSAGEPLHYKRITELAIEKNLLSHVGKTPEVTMSSRLAMLVKKDRGQSPIIKVKPGVFAIRESALADFAAAVAAAAAMEAESSSEDPAASSTVVLDAPKPPMMPGADVFPEEEGDDDPILAGLEQESDASKEGGRRRRRRRRRGKGGEKGDLPLDAAAPNGNGDAPREAAPREREPSGRDRNAGREAGREGGREGGRDNNRDRGMNRDRGPDRDRSPARDSRDANRDRPRPDAMAQLDWNRQPAEGDLLGKDLADAAWTVLSTGERIAHDFTRVADLLVRRGRLSGVAANLAPTIAAAARADIARSELARACPRFRIRDGRLLLTEWQLPKPLARAEQEMLNAADRYGHELRRALIQKLTELPAAGFAELVATWLNAEGVTALRAVRRPTSSITEFHFAGTRKRGSEETRLAIVVQRGNRDVQREAITDVRGSLHHYGQADAAWVISTCRISAGAREEAVMPGAVSCALFDGMGLATAMERLGIAVRSHVIAHHELDFDLLEALGDTAEQRDRREREERAARNAERGGRDEARQRPPREDRNNRNRDRAQQGEAAGGEGEAEGQHDEGAEPETNGNGEEAQHDEAVSHVSEARNRDEGESATDVDVDWDEESGGDDETVDQANAGEGGESDDDDDDADENDEGDDNGSEGESDATDEDADDSDDDSEGDDEDDEDEKLLKQ